MGARTEAESKNRVRKMRGTSKCKYGESATQNKHEKSFDKKVRVENGGDQKGRYFFDETIYHNDFDAFTDAEIARCEKRINEGYAVNIYQDRLKMIQRAKERRRYATNLSFRFVQD